MLSERDIEIQLTMTNAILVALCKRHPQVADDAFRILDNLLKNPQPEIEPSIVGDALLALRKIKGISN